MSWMAPASARTRFPQDPLEIMLKGRLGGEVRGFWKVTVKSES